jgi:hypothetical protein
MRISAVVYRFILYAYDVKQQNKRGRIGRIGQAPTDRQACPVQSKGSLVYFMIYGVN